MGVVVRPGATLQVQGPRAEPRFVSGAASPSVDWGTFYNKSAPGEVRWSQCAHACAARLWGPWDLQERSNGSFSKVALNWETPVSPFIPPSTPPGLEPLLLDREPWRACIYVWGGPWLFSECEIRCRGGTSLACQVFGGCWLMNCSLGGLSSHPMGTHPLIPHAKVKNFSLCDVFRPGELVS